MQCSLIIPLQLQNTWEIFKAYKKNVRISQYLNMLYNILHKRNSQTQEEAIKHVITAPVNLHSQQQQ